MAEGKERQGEFKKNIHHSDCPKKVAMTCALQAPKQAGKIVHLSAEQSIGNQKGP